MDIDNSNNKLKLIIHNNQLIELDNNLLNMLNLSKHNIGKISNKIIFNINKTKVKMLIIFL